MDAFGERRAHANVGSDEPRQQPRDRRHRVVDVEETRLEDLLAAEREQLARDRGRPLDCAPDFFDVGPRLVIRGDGGERELGVADHGGQRVVQIVRDAAGESPDRLHLLRLPKLILEVAPFGDVLHSADHADRAALVVANDVGQLVDPAHRPVDTHDAVLDVVALARFGRRPARSPHGVAVVGMNELEKRRGGADELARRHAEDAMRFVRPAEMTRSVELRDPAADVRDLLRPFEERAMLLDRVRRANGVADIAVARDAADDPPFDALRRDESFDDAAVAAAHQAGRLRRRVGPHRVGVEQERRRLVELRADVRGDCRDAAGHDVGGDAEDFEEPAVVPDQSAIQIEHDDAVVCRIERRLENRDRFFKSGRIGHASSFY